MNFIICKVFFLYNLINNSLLTERNTILNEIQLTKYNLINLNVFSDTSDLYRWHYLLLVQALAILCPNTHLKNKNKKFMTHFYKIFELGTMHSQFSARLLSAVKRGTVERAAPIGRAAHKRRCDWSARGAHERQTTCS